MDKLTKSIVISGPPAVGKTTIAKGIAEEFDLKFLAGGDLLKEMIGGILKMGCHF